MTYLHSLATPVVHHDLKPANLLVDANWTLKVSDFGMSRLKNYTYSSQCSAPGGTPEWMAPEALRGDTLSELSDVYSFGVILWELVTLNYPWRELSSPVQIVAQVAFLHRRLKVPEWVDKPIDELLHACWAREIQDRPTFASIVERLVGEYPSTWSHGETTAEEAAAILSALSVAKVDIIEDDHEDFVDASDEIVVARVEEFVPQGLARIRAPTPTTDQTARWRVEYSSEDSSAGTSGENSDEISGKNEFDSPLPDVDIMQAVKQFRPILSPVKSVRSG
jgi:serine/threonine protein kinase